MTDDDLWSAPLAGGVARRISGGRGLVGFPRLSPCGQWLAFIATDETHSELYVMPAQGGPARRLTWLGGQTHVAGWMPDGRIVFSSNANQPFFHMRQLFTIGLDDPLPTALPWGMASDIAFGPEGACVIGRDTRDPALWKRYRGGTAGHFWIDREGRGDFSRLVIARDGRVAAVTSPARCGSRTGSGSSPITKVLAICIHAPSPARELRRHTEHSEHYVRNASTDGVSIVYQCGGAIWRLSIAEGVSRPVPLEVPAARPQLARASSCWARPRSIRSSIHPDGHSLALCVRGKPVTLPFLGRRDAPVRRGPGGALPAAAVAGRRVWCRDDLGRGR